MNTVDTRLSHFENDSENNIRAHNVSISRKKKPPSISKAVSVRPDRQSRQ